VRERGYEDMRDGDKRGRKDVSKQVMKEKKIKQRLSVRGRACVGVGGERERGRKNRKGKGLRDFDMW